LRDVEKRYREESEMVKMAQEAVLHRPNFAIDAIGDSDGESEDEDDVGGADEGVMDEVSGFLACTDLWSWGCSTYGASADCDRSRRSSKRTEMMMRDSRGSKRE
jgi:hypothetical protein